MHGAQEGEKTSGEERGRTLEPNCTESALAALVNGVEKIVGAVWTKKPTAERLSTATEGGFVSLGDAVEDPPSVS